MGCCNLGSPTVPSTVEYAARKTCGLAEEITRNRCEILAAKALCSPPPVLNCRVQTDRGASHRSSSIHRRRRRPPGPKPDADQHATAPDEETGQEKGL